MDIFTAIKNSNLGKYQKAIDRCNNKSGCNSFCGAGRQEQCEKLRRHSEELEKVMEKVKKWPITITITILLGIPAQIAARNFLNYLQDQSQKILQFIVRSVKRK